jgi:hypothetical protein
MKTHLALMMMVKTLQKNHPLQNWSSLAQVPRPKQCLMLFLAVIPHVMRDQWSSYQTERSLNQAPDTPVISISGKVPI